MKRKHKENEIEAAVKWVEREDAKHLPFYRGFPLVADNVEAPSLCIVADFHNMARAPIDEVEACLPKRKQSASLNQT